MRPEDRDILFGDRFGGDWNGEWSGDWNGGADAGPLPMPGADVEALMDAYFDGEISDDDRVRLFGLLRRDPDRCLQFVEMQRTALLLERAPAGPDQTESILNSLGRYQVSQGGQGAAWHSYRIGPRVMRGAIAAAVLLAGAGLVMLGQWGPSRCAAPAQQPGAFEQSPEVAGGSAVEAPAGSPPTIASTPSPTGRPALRPGELRSLGASMVGDGGQIDTPIRGLAGPEVGQQRGQHWGQPPSVAMDPDLTPGLTAPGDPGFAGFEGFGQSSPREMRRLMGFTYGGYAPWSMYGVWGASDRWDPPPPPQRAPESRD